MSYIHSALVTTKNWTAMMKSHRRNISVAIEHLHQQKPMIVNEVEQIKLRNLHWRTILSMKPIRLDAKFCLQQMTGKNIHEHIVSFGVVHGPLAPIFPAKQGQKNLCQQTVAVGIKCQFWRKPFAPVIYCIHSSSSSSSSSFSSLLCEQLLWASPQLPSSQVRSRLICLAN